MDKRKLGAGVVILLTLIVIVISLFSFRKSEVELRKDEVYGPIIVEKDPKKLVLTLDDLGDGWMVDFNGTLDNDGYFTVFDSKESGSIRSDYRYKLASRVWILPDVESARSLYNKNKQKPIEDGFQIKNGKVGEESYLWKGLALGGVGFRIKNVVVNLYMRDIFEELDEDQLLKYAKIIEQKIKKAEAESP